jgi:hypothetical protein
MKNILLVIGLFFLIFLLAISDFGPPEGRMYDCGMAEWHPDIPTEVKEECRRRSLERWREQQEVDKKKLIST